MTLSVQFLYDINNIGLYTPNLPHTAIAIAAGCIFLVSMRYIFLYHIGIILLWKESRSIAAKKRTLGDLILMKDIQNEMEKELEQASLRATFQ